MDGTLTVLNSALMQVIFVLVLSGVVFVVRRFLLRRNDRSAKSNFFTFLGLKAARSQIDLVFFVALLVVVSVGSGSAWLQYLIGGEWRSMLLAESSPYGKILKFQTGLAAVASGVIYCFIQAAASEELLFRGLVARRLFSRFKFAHANLLQSGIFWLLHVVIFRFVTGGWFNLFQLYAFIVSFSLGLLFGFVNYRRGNVGILPSWILHGCGNFATFMTLLLLTT